MKPKGRELKEMHHTSHGQKPLKFPFPGSVYAFHLPCMISNAPLILPQTSLSTLNNSRLVY